MRAKLTSVSWYAPPRAGTRGGRSAIGPALDVDDGLVLLAVTLEAALAVPAFFDGAASCSSKKAASGPSDRSPDTIIRTNSSTRPSRPTSVSGLGRAPYRLRSNNPWSDC